MLMGCKWWEMERYEEQVGGERLVRGDTVIGLARADDDYCRATTTLWRRETREGEGRGRSRGRRREERGKSREGRVERGQMEIGGRGLGREGEAEAGSSHIAQL